MRKLWIVVFFIFVACASTDPAPVAVIGSPEDLMPIAGEWIGTYESLSTGRSGNITFHLTENPKGAHGDVLMVPRREVVMHSSADERHFEPFEGSSVLSIEFVQIAAGEISGKIAPYPDPEAPENLLETHFAGHVSGDVIEGTFVTYSGISTVPRRGRWRVHRMSEK